MSITNNPENVVMLAVTVLIFIIFTSLLVMMFIGAPAQERRRNFRTCVTNGVDKDKCLELLREKKDDK
jgi:peptidoglycan/LPS O-acetylase OafA/YrhL